MSPTIGRIVHYAHRSGDVYPAIVTQVHDNDLVHLTVFTPALLEHIYIVPYDANGASNTWRWPPLVLTKES